MSERLYRLPLYGIGLLVGLYMALAAAGQLPLAETSVWLASVLLALTATLWARAQLPAVPHPLVRAHRGVWLFVFSPVLIPYYLVATRHAHTGRRAVAVVVALFAPWLGYLAGGSVVALTDVAPRYVQLEPGGRWLRVTDKTALQIVSADPLLRWIVLTIRHMEAPETSSERLASTLVHEAIHARLASVGIEYVLGIRARIEVVCSKEELAFARRLPGASELVATLEAQVARFEHDGEARWSDAKFRNDELRAARDDGMPELLVRLLAWVIRRRAA